MEFVSISIAEDQVFIELEAAMSNTSLSLSGLLKNDSEILSFNVKTPVTN